MEEAKHRSDFALSQQLRETFQGLMDACVRPGDHLDVFKDRVAQYLAQNPDVSEQEVYREFRDAHRKTLLHFACQGGNAKIVEAILQAAPDLADETDEHRTSPLMLAAQANHPTVVDVLLRHEVEINRRNKDGTTAAHFAADSGAAEILCMLGARDLDLSLQSEAGTPLHWAAGAGQLHTLQVILRAGVDVNATNEQGLSAVIMAAARGSDGCVAELVRHGADVGALLSGGLTVLHICAEMGCETAVTEILGTPTGRRCAALKTTEGHTPAELAGAGGYKHIVELLWPYSELPGSVDQFMQDCLIRAQSDQTNIDESKQVASTDPEPKVALEPTLPPQSSQDEALSETYKAEGNAAFSVKQYSAAIDKYSAALRLNGTNHALWSNRSACFMAIGDPERALADAEVCRKLKPDWPKACYRMAVARLALRKYEDAAVSAWEGVSLDQNNEDLKNILKQAVEQGRKAHQASSLAS